MIEENAGGVDTEFSVFMLYLASAAIRKRDPSRSLFWCLNFRNPVFL